MKEDKRFTIIEKQSLGMTGKTAVLQDKQTGVQYLLIQAGYGCGVTPLLDREGKPAIGSRLSG